MAVTAGFTPVAPRAVLIRLPSAKVIIIVGTIGRSPPPKLNVGGSPAALFAMRTATAPAFVARSTLRLTAQAPRSMRATFPAGLLPLKYGSGTRIPAVGSTGQPRPSRTTSPLNPAPTGAQSTVAVLVIVVGGVMPVTTSGKANALGTWVCATLITSGVEEGEPTM